MLRWADPASVLTLWVFVSGVAATEEIEGVARILGRAARRCRYFVDELASQ